ncbi:DNA-binding XRE family transcriptional regulator [Duganella sp. BK701]|nr:DNA-binding XRE family transcriptional regulator [Duganella sp. BK701]
MAIIGKRLKAARLGTGLSQEQLGLNAGLEVESASARMNRYERGTRVPSVELLERIGKVLNLPLAYFFAVDDDEAALLTAYHRLPEADKQAVLAVAMKER